MDARFDKECHLSVKLVALWMGRHRLRRYYLLPKFLTQHSPNLYSKMFLGLEESWDSLQQRPLSELPSIPPRNPETAAWEREPFDYYLRFIFL